MQESHDTLTEQAANLSKQVQELKEQTVSLQTSATSAELRISALDEQLATENAANKAHQETVERQTQELQVQSEHTQAMLFEACQVMT